MLLLLFIELNPVKEGTFIIMEGGHGASEGRVIQKNWTLREGQPLF